MVKTALITGITGQDGSYLAELLLSKGYEVHGVIRRASTFNTRRIDHIYKDPHVPGSRLLLHYGDLSSAEQFSNLIYSISPDEVYHLGAQSHVQVSFEMPEYTGNITGLAVTRMLETLRRGAMKTRFYQAASSEMFGDTPPPQSEQSPLRPQSPYAAAKAYAFWLTQMYRQGYGIFACSGILFNHESPRRGETFVTRKITRAVAHILAGKQSKLYLGNLDARRDWGYAPEYVETIHLMLQRDDPEDFVIGTGESHSVEEFVAEAFSYVGLDWQQYVERDPRYLRPLDVPALRADTSKANRVLGWKPRVNWRQLVRIMVDADMETIGLDPPGEGQKVLKEKFTGWHQWSGAVSKALKAAQDGTDQ